MDNRRRILMGVLAAAMVLGATALPSFAAKPQPEKIYDLAVTPLDGAGPNSKLTTDSSVFVKVTNKTSGNSSYNSFSIFAPSPFTVTAASIFSSDPAQAVPPAIVSFSANRVDVTSLDPVRQNKFVQVKVTVSVGSLGTCGTNPSGSWRTEVWTGSSLAGSMFNLKVGTGLITSVTKICGIRFGTQPTDAVAGETITGTAFTPGASNVTVEVFDGSGVVTGDDSTEVTLTASGGPGTLTSETETASGGIATFDPLSIDAAGTYTLTATAGSLTADSDGFTIFAGTIDCENPATGSSGEGGTDVMFTQTTGCDGAAKPYTLTTADREIDFTTTSVDPEADPVTFEVAITAWAPEPVANPVPVSTVYPPDGGEPGVWCGGTSIEPMMPGAHSWCLVSQSTELVSDGMMQVTEHWLLIGDAKIGRG